MSVVEVRSVSRLVKGRVEFRYDRFPLSSCSLRSSSRIRRRNTMSDNLSDIFDRRALLKPPKSDKNQMNHFLHSLCAKIRAFQARISFDIVSTTRSKRCRRVALSNLPLRA